jgi:hypothetical protein
VTAQNLKRKPERGAQFPLHQADDRAKFANGVNSRCSTMAASWDPELANRLFTQPLGAPSPAICAAKQASRYPCPSQEEDGKILRRYIAKPAGLQVCLVVEVD